VVELFNIYELANGAVGERLDEEYQKVLQNINDPNTDPTKARKIILTFVFKPEEERDMSDITFSVARMSLCVSATASVRLALERH
jgi:hypothetical protein